MEFESLIISQNQTINTEGKDFLPYKNAKINDIYGINPSSEDRNKVPSVEISQVVELLEDIELPLHQNREIRNMLLSLDAHYMLPTRYYQALSSILEYAISLKRTKVQEAK
ncbi:MAG: hypothetical protein Kapaf2KO_16960 [Candidatus Kapaibacteriales bacterium]